MFSSIETTNTILLVIAIMIFWIQLRVDSIRDMLVDALTEMKNDTHRTAVNVGAIQMDVHETCERMKWTKADG